MKIEGHGWEHSQMKASLFKRRGEESADNLQA